MRLSATHGVNKMQTEIKHLSNLILKKMSFATLFFGNDVICERVKIRPDVHGLSKQQHSNWPCLMVCCICRATHPHAQEDF